MSVFPSKERLDEYWEGDISHLYEAEPDRGVPDELWALFDLWHGECRVGSREAAGAVSMP